MCASEREGEREGEREKGEKCLGLPVDYPNKHTAIYAHNGVPMR